MEFNYRPTTGHHVFNVGGLQSQSQAANPTVFAPGKTDNNTLNRFSESTWAMLKTKELAERIEKRDHRNLVVLDSKDLPIGGGTSPIKKALKEDLKKQSLRIAPNDTVQDQYLGEIAEFINANGPWAAFDPPDKANAKVLVSGYKAKDPYELVKFFAGATFFPQGFKGVDFQKLGLSPAAFDNDRFASFLTWHEAGHQERLKYLITRGRGTTEPLDKLMCDHHVEAQADSYATIMTAANGDFEFAKDFGKLRTVFCLNAGAECFSQSNDISLQAWTRYNNERVIGHTAALMEKIRDKKWGAVDHELMNAFKAYHNAKGEAPQDAHSKAFAEKEEVLNKLNTFNLIGLREDEDTVYRISTAMTVFYGMTEPELKAALMYAKGLSNPAIAGKNTDLVEWTGNTLKAEFGDKMTNEQRTYLHGLQKTHDNVLDPGRGKVMKECLITSDLKELKQSSLDKGTEPAAHKLRPHLAHSSKLVPE